MRYCDLSCPDARVPDKPADGARSCMTFTAIWCAQLGRLVYKSSPCEWQRMLAKQPQAKNLAKLQSD